MSPIHLDFDREEIRGSLVERFEKVVSKYPKNLAIKYAQGEFSYERLNREANRLAYVLLDIDQESKTPVAMFLSHNANPIVGMLGILKAGKAYVPLNPSSPDERIMKILKFSGAGIVITDQNGYKRLSTLSLNSEVEIVNIEKISSDYPSDNPGIRIKPDDLIAIIYTSGSTGVPKGVMHVQQTILHYTGIQTKSLNIKSRDRHILISHLSYVSGTTDIFRTLLNGASLFPVDFLNVGLKGLNDTIQKEKITIYHSVPTIFRRLIEEQAKGKKYPSVRIIHLGGEPVYAGDVRLIRNHFSADCVLLNNLGSTEVPTYRRYEVTKGMTIEDGNLPVGYPVTDKKVMIVDEQGQELGVGQSGEIVIESKYMSWGYFNDPERTRKSYRPVPTADQPGRFYSGDLGLIDPGGMMKFLGRKDYQVKIHGNRVELGEVEANMLSLDGVHQAVALVKKKEQDNILVGYLVLSKGTGLSTEEIRQRLLEKLPVFMVPKEFIIMDSFPYTQTNKIDRERLPEPDFGKGPNHQDIVLPRTELEQKLAGIWQETLKISQIGIRDNFFALGGDSLTAVNLFLSIEDSFGVKMPISILLEAGDIEKQAMILSNTDYIADWSPIIEVQPLGSKPPLFCLFGKGGNPLTFRQMSEYFGEDQPMFFLQARGLSGRETPLKIVEDIAADFIEEIKKVWPKGPYRFCGASFGGVVGYEIAQQLKARKEDVDLVVLFDTYGPGYPQFIPGMSKLKKKTNKVGYYLNKHISNFQDADRQERINYMRYYRDFIPELWKMMKRNTREKVGRWKSERLIPAEIKEVIRANVEASAKYHPNPYNGKVVLFKATKQPPGVISDPKLGWGSVDIQDLMIHEVEAHHGSILFEPRVKEVVEIMKHYLN